MPYKARLCGIYCITAPSGSQYVGSSNHIRLRWSEHRSNLRRSVHHSERLQAAWNKYGSRLAFSVVEECLPSVLNEREQHWIDVFSPVLNTTAFVRNVWTNESTRLKLRRCHTSPEWKAARSAIAKKNTRMWRQVECSNGCVYPSMTSAAKCFGVRTSAIKHLATTQYLGKLRVRFRFINESWKPIKTRSQSTKEARARNGTNHHTEEAKRKMRLAKIGKPHSRSAQGRFV